MPRSDLYDLERVAEGVFAGVARYDGSALSNSGLVDLGDETLIFDTSPTVRAARDLESVAPGLTGHRISLAANSHWHFDHTFGNRRFSELPIYATRRTREILTERRDEFEAELARAALERYTRELEDKARTEGPGRRREESELFARLYRAMGAEANERRVAPPNRDFEGARFRLPGRRRAELVTFGSGHTESDAVLFLPDEGVLFAGDLVVVDHHPNLGSGDPEHWGVVLEEIARLEPERIVPGHGPVASAEAATTVRDYLSAILALDANEGIESMPARFRDLRWPTQFDENVAFLRARGRERTSAEDAG
jgi:glyoxylase-like metal-dependent hydrolase (beta-lactamase superfamily II)